MDMVGTPRKTLKNKNKLISASEERKPALSITKNKRNITKNTCKY